MRIPIGGQRAQLLVFDSIVYLFEMQLLMFLLLSFPASFENFGGEIFQTKSLWWRYCASLHVVSLATASIISD